MGETAQVEFTARASRELAKMLREATEAAATLVIEGVAEQLRAPRTADAGLSPARCEQFHGEPYTNDAGDTLAFLDDHGLLRFVGAGRVPDIPAGWRPLLVGKPVQR